jgi:hypothetical protein
VPIWWRVINAPGCSTWVIDRSLKHDEIELSAVENIYRAAMGLYVLLPFVLVALASGSAAYTAAAQNDRIVSLPGATSALLSNQFSGYLNVTSTRGIHYMYFESERDPEKDPVIFWTNGGPGTFPGASCSPHSVTSTI